MALLLLFPAIVSLLLFGAHLFRSGAPVLVLALPFLLCLLLVPRGWVARFFQLLLTLTALEWVRTAIYLANARQEAGEPWLRTVLILGAVVLLNLVSVVLFEMGPLRRLYPRHCDV